MEHRTRVMTCRDCRPVTVSPSSIQHMSVQCRILESKYQSTRSVARIRKIFIEVSPAKFTLSEEPLFGRQYGFLNELLL